MKSKGKSPRISVTLEGAEREELESLSKAKDRSLSWLAHQAIRFYLSERRKGARAVRDFDGAES